MLVDVYEQIERVIDLTDPALNHLYSMSVEEARTLILDGPAESVSRIRGSFALLAKRGRRVR
ncbi:MAG: asparagine synthetase B family protein, partial [Nitrosotalea sp.]